MEEKLKVDYHKKHFLFPGKKRKEKVFDHPRKFREREKK